MLASRLLLERRDRHDPGVVDDDVDRPEPALDVVEERGEAGKVGDVERQPDDRVAELGGGALRRLAVDVADRDTHALRDQRLRDRPSYAPRSARDDGSPAAQRARLLGHACQFLLRKRRSVSRERYRYAPLGR